MQRVPVLLLLAATGLALAAGVRAWAGVKYSNIPSVWTDSSGAKRLSAPYMGARFTQSPDTFVSCYISSWANGTKYGSCSARDSSGDFFSCAFTDPEHIERIQQIDVYGGNLYIKAHPTNGTCEYLSTTKSSAYIWQ